MINTAVVVTRTAINAEITLCISGTHLRRVQENHGVILKTIGCVMLIAKYQNVMTPSTTLKYEKEWFYFLFE